MDIYGKSNVVVENLTADAIYTPERMVLNYEEPLFSNEELIAPRQRYPGEINPVLPDWKEFPLPDRVGQYGTKEEFLASPKFPAQWVHFEERAKLVFEGKYHEVPPLHFEGIFTLVCNFCCPHCSRGPTRRKWVIGGTWENNTLVSSANTMSLEGMYHALNNIASMKTDDYIGVIWGGGDPTSNPFVYDAMFYAKSLGIKSSFLTNGVFIDVDKLVKIEPVLVRISLNCGTEEQYIKFHGYPKDWDYFPRVLNKTREFAKGKKESHCKTLFGISLIVDERNLDDIVAAAEIIKQIEEETGPGGIDYVIVRPVMNYSHFEMKFAKIKDDTKQNALDVVLGPVKRLLESCDIPLVTIKDSFLPPPPLEYYDIGTDCLSYSWAGEVRHNGDVQLCSDSYGNPEYTIGNLLEKPLDEIWTSDKRKEVLEKINRSQCFKNRCPHNSRGHHLNRIFHQVEAFRKNGRMDEVKEWARRLKQVTLPLNHSFFL